MNYTLQRLSEQKVWEDWLIGKSVIQLQSIVELFYHNRVAKSRRLAFRILDNATGNILEVIE